jgi:hypothetical protein
MNRILFILSMLVGLPFLAFPQTLVNQGAILHIGNGAKLQVQGDIVNMSNADLRNNGTLEIHGDVINHQAMSTYFPGTLTFAGSTPQIHSGSSPFLTHNLVLNNPTQITNSNELRVNNECSFMNGVMDIASNTTPLVFASTATINNNFQPTNLSHVNGYVMKEGTGSFTYPVGDGTTYQPVTVNLSQNNVGMQVRYSPGNGGGSGYGNTGSMATPLLAHNTLEHWDILPLGSATGMVTLYWDNYRNLGISDANHIKVGRLGNNQWQNEGQVANGTAAQGQVTSNSLNSWGIFTQGSTHLASPLPIVLTTFYGESKNDHNVIFWTTAQETNNRQFILQRSADAIHFQDIETIASQAENGNSTIPLHYQTIDSEPYQGTTYYRLVQMDIDGSTTYSKIIRLLNAFDSQITVFPLPAVNEVNVTLYNQKDETVQVTLADPSGKLVKQIITAVQRGHNQIPVSLHNLASGSYLLTLHGNGKLLSTKTIIKE